MSQLLPLPHPQSRINRWVDKINGPASVRPAPGLSSGTQRNVFLLSRWWLFYPQGEGPESGWGGRGGPFLWEWFGGHCEERTDNPGWL